MSAPVDKRTVSGSDLIPLNGDLQNLSFARHIELVKSKPQEFGLEKWTRFFKIPNYLMQRIYRDQVYKDTDKMPPPGSTEVEKLSKYQKEILRDWLKHKSPLNNRDPDMKTRSVALAELDDLKEDLEQLPDADLVDYCDIPYRGFCGDIEKTIENSKRGLKEEPKISRTGIPIICGHEYKSEEEIARIAIDKMNHLSPEEEKKFQDLLEDDEFMNFLSLHVEKYLKFCGVLEA